MATWNELNQQAKNNPFSNIGGKTPTVKLIQSESGKITDLKNQTETTKGNADYANSFSGTLKNAVFGNTVFTALYLFVFIGLL